MKENVIWEPLNMVGGFETREKFHDESRDPAPASATKKPRLNGAGAKRAKRSTKAFHAAS